MDSASVAGIGELSIGANGSAVGAEDQRSTALMFRRDPTGKLCVALLFASVWLIGHGYVGLQHDARLYAMQALANSDSELFANDLFLAYGSQDQFTLFTKLVAPLAVAVGVETTVFMLSSGGSLLWLFGLLMLARRLLPGWREWRVGTFCLLALPAYYGAIEIFAVGRALATPRVFAESFVLFGLAAWIKQYRSHGQKAEPVSSFRGAATPWLVAATLMLLAALFHPLMAMAGMLVLVLEWSLVRRRLGIAVSVGVLGGAVFFGLAMAGVAPFDRILSTLDATWLEIVQVRSEHLFVAGWEARDWTRPAVLLVISGGAARLLGGWRGRFVAAVALTGVLGIALNTIGADLLKNVLMTQLQFFRLAWLLHAIGPLAAGVVIVRALRSGTGGAYSLALLGFGAALAWAGHSPLQGVMAVGLCSIGLILLWRPLPDALEERPWALWLPIVGTALLLALAGFARVQYALQGVGSVDYRAAAEVFQARSVPQLVLAAALIPLLAARVGRTGLRVATVFAAMLTALMVAVFDQRTTVAIASTKPEILEDIRASIPKGAGVYWQNQVNLPWFALQRPSYVTQAQAAGVVFNRSTALEYARRLRAVGSWDENYTELYSDGPKLDPTAVRARALCEDVNAPFALVFQRELAQLEVPLRKIEVEGLRDHWLYYCNEMIGQSE